MILVPVPERNRVLLTLPKADLQYEWFGDLASSMVEKTDPFTGRTFRAKSDGSMALHFLCAYDFSITGEGYLISNGKEFAKKVMPLLQLSLVLLQNAIESGARMYDLPLPVHSWDQNTVKEMIQIMQMAFVNDEKPVEEQKRIEDFNEIIKATHGIKDKSPDEEAKLIRKLQMTGISSSMWELDAQLEEIDPEGKQRGLERITGLDGTDSWVKANNVKQWQLRSAVHLSGTSDTAQDHLVALKLANKATVANPKERLNKPADFAVEEEEEDGFEEAGDDLVPLPPSLKVNMSPQVGATRRRISVSKALGEGLLGKHEHSMHGHVSKAVAGSAAVSELDIQRRRASQEQADLRRRASLALDLAI
jgi:hypothetical protein